MTDEMIFCCLDGERFQFLDSSVTNKTALSLRYELSQAAFTMLQSFSRPCLVLEPTFESLLALEVFLELTSDISILITDHKFFAEFSKLYPTLAICGDNVGHCEKNEVFEYLSTHALSPIFIGAVPTLLQLDDGSIGLSFNGKYLSENLSKIKKLQMSGCPDFFFSSEKIVLSIYSHLKSVPPETWEKESTDLVKNELILLSERITLMGEQDTAHFNIPSRFTNYISEIALAGTIFFCDDPINRVSRAKYNHTGRNNSR